MKGNGSGRPLVFHSNHDMKSFVFKETPQSQSISIPPLYTQNISIPPLYTQNISALNHFRPVNNQGSLFQRYFKNNLTLSSCDQRDLTTVYKNIVMHQENLSPTLNQQITQVQHKKNSLNKTGQLWTSPPSNQDQFLMTAPIPKPSKQYFQNQIIFNYKDIGAAKKQRKTDFLNEIQKRISEAQKDIKDIENLQQIEKTQICQFNNLREQIGQNIKIKVEKGKINQKIDLATFEQQEISTRPPHIHPQMQNQAINQVLDEHFKLNQDILELAASARGSRTKSNQKWNKFTSDFDKPIKKAGFEKTIVATNKYGRKNPPKSKQK